jgi:hypothetical protein
MLLTLVLLCGSACGLESTWFTKLDVSLCYSYAHVSSSSTSGLGSQSLHGAEMSVSYHLTPWLRVALDFGLASAGNRDNDIVDISLRGAQSNYLLRSCLVFPVRRVTPLSQVLWALSEGADYQLTTRFALRPIRVEFVQTNFLELQDNKLTQNDLCVSTGIALRF